MEIKNVLRKNIIGAGKDFVDLRIVVKPASPEEKLSIEGDELVFETQEPPIQGRANAALLRTIARILRIPTSNIEIRYGARSRVKTLRIYSVDEEQLLDALSSFLAKEK